MVNSSEQFLKTKSTHLKDISSSSDFMNRSVQNTDYISYDYNNLYRSSYNDMSNKVNKVKRIFNIIIWKKNLEILHLKL